MVVSRAVGLGDALCNPTSVGRACWDADALKDQLMDYAQRHLDGGASVLVFDEAGFIKKTKQV